MGERGRKRRTKLLLPADGEGKRFSCCIHHSSSFLLLFFFFSHCWNYFFSCHRWNIISSLLELFFCHHWNFFLFQSHLWTNFFQVIARATFSFFVSSLELFFWLLELFFQVINGTFFFFKTTRTFFFVITGTFFSLLELSSHNHLNQLFKIITGTLFQLSLELYF